MRDPTRSCRCRDWYKYSLFSDRGNGISSLPSEIGGGRNLKNVSLTFHHHHPSSTSQILGSYVCLIGYIFTLISLLYGFSHFTMQDTHFLLVFLSLKFLLYCNLPITRTLSMRCVLYSDVPWSLWNLIQGLSDTPRSMVAWSDLSWCFNHACPHGGSCLFPLMAKQAWLSTRLVLSVYVVVMVHNIMRQSSHQPPKTKPHIPSLQLRGLFIGFLLLCTRSSWYVIPYPLGSWGYV